MKKIGFLLFVVALTILALTACAGKVPCPEWAAEVGKNCRVVTYDRVFDAESFTLQAPLAIGQGEVWEKGKIVLVTNEKIDLVVNVSFFTTGGQIVSADEVKEGITYLFKNTVVGEKQQSFFAITPMDLSSDSSAVVTLVKKSP